jgi:ferredoxin
MVIFEKEGVAVSCNAGTNLRKLAGKQGISLYSGIWRLLNCRGNGLCKKCEVEVPVGENISPKTSMEEIQLKGKPATRRLGCQVYIHGDTVVRTHPPK